MFVFHPVVCVVTDLKVLPDCEFRALYAQPRVVKTYAGYRQVHESRVYPKDDTTFKRSTRPDRGNTVILKQVSAYSADLGVLTQHFSVFYLIHLVGRCSPPPTVIFELCTFLASKPHYWTTWLPTHAPLTPPIIFYPSSTCRYTQTWSYPLSRLQNLTLNL